MQGSRVHIHLVADKHQLSRDVRKSVFGISDQERHKSRYTATGDGWRLEILYLGRGGIVLSA